MYFISHEKDFDGTVLLYCSIYATLLLESHNQPLSTANHNTRATFGYRVLIQYCTDLKLLHIINFNAVI